jgi:hypothetical protein
VEAGEAIDAAENAVGARVWRCDIDELEAVPGGFTWNTPRHS